MNEAPKDRGVVRKFFHYQLPTKKLERRPLRYQPCLIAAGIAIIVLGGIGIRLELGAKGMLWLTGMTFLLSFCGALLLDKKLAEAELGKRRDERRRGEEKFRQLARDTRSIQASDLLRAFRRIFERTQLSRSELRTLNQRFFFGREKELFEEESLQHELGDLFNKSVRFVSQGSFSNEIMRQIRWDKKHVETFFNPLRLVALFLTESQLILCDVQIDSMDWNLDEQIQRISLNKVVNVCFSAKRMRHKINKEKRLEWAADLDCDESEIEEIRRSNDEDYHYEMATSVLDISGSDSALLRVPIGVEVHLGRGLDGSDDHASLTKDEIAIDRMVNELNRLVVQLPSIS